MVEDKQLIEEAVLDLDRCPRCGVDRPSMGAVTSTATTVNSAETRSYTWRVYACRRCGQAVLAGGRSSTDPIRAIRSNEFRLGLKQLQEHADVIIIDSPPIREVPDGLLLAQLVDGVLCIADVRRDSRSDIQIMIETVRLTNAKILGIVLNKVVSSWQKYPYSNKRYFTHDGQE